jgi:hypothetical protein
MVAWFSVPKKKKFDREFGHGSVDQKSTSRVQKNGNENVLKVIPKRRKKKGFQSSLERDDIE